MEFLLVAFHFNNNRFQSGDDIQIALTPNAYYTVGVLTHISSDTTHTTIIPWVPVRQFVNFSSSKFFRKVFLYFFIRHTVTRPCVCYVTSQAFDTNMMGCIWIVVVPANNSSRWCHSLLFIWNHWCTMEGCLSSLHTQYHMNHQHCKGTPSWQTGS